MKVAPATVRRAGAVGLSPQRRAGAAV